MATTRRENASEGDSRSRPNEATRTPTRDGTRTGTAARARDSPDREPATHPLGRFQRSVGNQAVQRFVNERTRRRVQPELVVGRPGDRFEREADRVARDVSVRRGRPPDGIRVQERPTREAAHSVHRQASEGGEEAAPAVVGEVVRRPGRPLDGATRSAMETRFGHDFGAVRVHHGAKAAESARAVNARAYTVGTDVVFGAGEYRPETPAGDRLLAHELTHVVQQTAATADRHTGLPAERTPGVVRRQTTADPAPAETSDVTSVRRLLDRVLPVGQGFYLGGSVGITPVIPVYASEEALVYIDRPDADHVHLFYRNRGQVNLDAAVGAGIGFGKKQRGTDGATIGADVGAQAAAGVEAVIIQEYLVPISEFEQYLLDETVDLISEQISGAFLVGGASLPKFTLQRALTLSMDAFTRGGRLDRYEVLRKVEFGLFAQADAEASVRFRERPDAATRYTRSGDERPGELSRPGLRPDRDQGETGPELKTRNLQWALNHLLPTLRLGARLGLTTGYELTPNESETSHTTDLRIYLEGEATSTGILDIPLVSALPIPTSFAAGGGIGVAFDLQLRSTPGEDRYTGFDVEVYTTSGELDYYAGEGTERTLGFDALGLFTQQDIEQLFEAMRAPAGAPTPPLLADVGLKKRLKGAIETVKVRQRYQIGGPIGLRFNAFARRQGSTRVLISDTNQWRKIKKALDVSGYLTVTYSLEGPDLIRVLRLLAEAAPDAARAVGDAVDGDGSADIGAAYDALMQYAVEFAASDQGLELKKALLDGVNVTEATVRFSVGGALGGQFRLRAGAGVRLGGYLEAGMYCEHDFVEELGGMVSLRTFSEQAARVYEDPREYMPECPIVHAMFNVLNGEEYVRISGTGSGPSEPDITSGDAKPSGEIMSPSKPAETVDPPVGSTTPVEEEPTEQGREADIRELTAEPAEDPSTKPLDRTLRSLEVTRARRRRDPGTYELLLVLRWADTEVVDRIHGVPVREVKAPDADGDVVRVVLDSKKPYQLTPEGVAILPGREFGFDRSVVTE